MLDDQTQLEFPASGLTETPLIWQPQVVRCQAAGPGGRPLMVLIDTGTDPSAIDLALARRLDLRIGDFALGSDAASDAVPFTETVLPWLRIGDLTLRHFYAMAVDLSHAPFPVDIVLGYNVLHRLNLTIDYAKHTIRLCHPDLAPPPPGPNGATLPLRFFEHFPAVTAQIIAPHPVEVLLTIDTGSNGALTLSPDLAATLGLGEHPTPAATGHGFAAATPVVLGMTVAMQIGPFRFPAVEVDVPVTNHGDLGRQGRANAGNRLLSRFQRLTLDYRREVCIVDSQHGTKGAEAQSDSTQSLPSLQTQRCTDTRDEWGS
ncbi:aspartyl protease family protein [uncultured Chloroflexus sp.]|uniref:aspartyl protease family protein n=1 Tax=uncultured Chloroflexus sp. TaxID=214040 RepID=UPI002602C7D6|nr:aspartyl protease family protein [uncultured Chloroflexus sp.]